MTKILARSVDPSECKPPICAWPTLCSVCCFALSAKPLAQLWQAVLLLCAGLLGPLLVIAFSDPKALHCCKCSTLENASPAARRAHSGHDSDLQRAASLLALSAACQRAPCRSALQDIQLRAAHPAGPVVSSSGLAIPASARVLLPQSAFRSSTATARQQLPQPESKSADSLSAGVHVNSRNLLGLVGRIQPKGFARSWASLWEVHPAGRAWPLCASHASGCAGLHMGSPATSCCP